MMRRILTAFLWLSLLAPVGMAQYTTPNLGLNVPPHHAAGWDTLENANFVNLDNIFAGITPTKWRARLQTGESYLIQNAGGTTLFKVDQNGTVTIYGSLTCTQSPCGNGSGSTSGGGTTSGVTFGLASGSYTVSQSLTLVSAGNTINWCTTSTGSCTPNTAYTGAITVNATEIVCAQASNISTGSSAVSCTGYTIGTSGTGGGGVATDPGTNIGTIVRQDIMSDGGLAFKTCYVGSSVCSGGVGSNAPAATPQSQFGLSTPNASSGTANAVASFTVTTTHPAPAFTDVLWTTTGGGMGADTTSTNWYREFYEKTAFPAGHTHLEFDTFNFDTVWDWMWGTQCNSTSNLIQYDNQNNGWVNTDIPCSTMLDGNWHHVKQTFHRTLAADRSCASGTAPCQTWDAMVIDGTTYAIGKTLPATSQAGWSGSGGQWQLDTEPTTASSGTPAVATVYVDTDKVIAGSDGGATTNPGGNGGSTAGTGELDSFNFDSGTPTSVGLTAVGSPTVGTSVFHSSPNGGVFPAGNNYFTDTLSTPSLVVYSRQYIQITSLGSNSNAFLRYYTAGGAELFSFFFNATNGFPSVFNQAANVTTTMQSSAYPVGSLHYIETYVKMSATVGQIICKIDNTTIYTSAATLNTGTSSIGAAWFGQIGGTTPAGWGTTYQDNVDFSALGWIGPI